MSQNDFTLANQSFPAFRADLNSALQALASNNSGTSAPSTTFANMWWYDSTNNIMYIRNEDNDAWIKFAELDQTNDKFVLSGTLQLDDGTVSAPALTFNSDTNMGIYRGGTDILKFVTAGTDAVTIDASQNVGIGSSSLSNKLTVNGNQVLLANGELKFADATSNQVGIIRNSGSSATSQLEFLTASTERIRISAIGDISFYEDTGTTPKLFWDASAESLTIGTATTTPNGAADDLVIAKSGSTGLNFISGTSDAQTIAFGDTSDSLVGSLQYFHNDDHMEFTVNNAEAMRIDNNGNLTVGTTDINPYDNTGEAGIALRSTGAIYNSISSGIPLILNRMTTDGTIAQFRQAGSTVGNIGSTGGALMHIGFREDATNPVGLGGSGSDTGTVIPVTTSGSERDGAISLGKSSARFKNLYLSGSIANPSGDLTLDISGNINIDADGGNVVLKDGGTSFGQFSIDNNGLTIVVPTINTDFRVNGNDGGSTITALQLDMSDGGTAIFNKNADFGDGSGIRLGASQDFQIYHDGSHNYINATTNSDLVFFANGDQRFRIDASGHILLANRTSIPTTAGGTGFDPDTNGRMVLHLGSSSTSAQGLVSFKNGNGEVGNIVTSGTSTAYNTSSDHRLKENISYDFDATTRLKQLRPARFNFIADADTTVDGFLAHEVSTVVPEAVSGVKDATQPIGNITDADNNILEENVKEPFEILDGQTWTQTGTEPVYQGIDQSKLVPLLVKTIQELEARITALETA